MRARDGDTGRRRQRGRRALDRGDSAHPFGRRAYDDDASLKGRKFVPEKY